MVEADQTLKEHIEPILVFDCRIDLFDGSNDLAEITLKHREQNDSGNQEHDAEQPFKFVDWVVVTEADCGDCCKQVINNCQHLLVFIPVVILHET